MNKTKENKNECNECNHEINDNENAYVHCPTCIEELRDMKSALGKKFKDLKENDPRSFARLEFAITPSGFEVSCVRHDQKIYEFDIREFMKGYFENVANKEVH